ncbi:MAG TPA: RNA polymerase sigma factor [Ktedonobacteraceae bacterium]
MFQLRRDHALSLADDVLVKQAQAGDEQAFRILYEQYFHKIYLYLTRMVGKDTIGSELTQETFVKVWQALPDLREPKTFTSWLYRIATHTAYDYQRRSPRVLLKSYDEEPMLLDGFVVEGPERQVEAEEEIRLALARVTFKYRACFVLYHIQQYSKQEIAEFLDLAESSVTTYISAALEEFRQHRANLRIDSTA